MPDADEPSHPHLRRRGPSTTSFVADVTPPATPSAVASMQPELSAALDEMSDATSLPPPPTKGIPSTMKVLSNSSSDDWAAEEKTRQDVKATRTSGAELFRRKSTHPVTVHHHQQEHHIGIQDTSKNDGSVVRLSQDRKVLRATQPSANLHGKDLRRFLSIGSIEPIARHSNSVDWSDTIASEIEEMDHLSLMDPYYDLTRSKLTKLFSLFHPDGTSLRYLSLRP
jgi:hypothetical protein